MHSNSFCLRGGETRIWTTGCIEVVVDTSVRSCSHSHINVITDCIKFVAPKLGECPSTQLEPRELPEIASTQLNFGRFAHGPARLRMRLAVLSLRQLVMLSRARMASFSHEEDLLRSCSVAANPSSTARSTTVCAPFRSSRSLEAFCSPCYECRRAIWECSPRPQKWDSLHHSLPLCLSESP